MSNEIPQPSGVLWSLIGASGEELKCETHHTETTLHLRFRTSEGILCTSKPIEASELESWTRVWRAFYLTSGWSEASAARLGHRRYRARPAPRPVPRVASTATPLAQPRPRWVHVVTGPILRYWAVTGPQGSTIVCELVRTKSGLEVRCNASPERAQPVHSMAEGLELSNAWRSAYRIGNAFQDNAGA
jgi:hypothetical protein